VKHSALPRASISALSVLIQPSNSPNRSGWYRSNPLHQAAPPMQSLVRLICPVGVSRQRVAGSGAVGSLPPL
jgi:hypothetical protein